MLLYERFLKKELCCSYYTLGCKVNQYETEVMQERLGKIGITKCESGEPDIIIINSCTVTGESDNKTRKLLRRLRREHEGSVIVLTGCYAQVCEDTDRLIEADMIIGTKNRSSITEIIESYLKNPRRIVLADKYKKGDGFSANTINSFDERTRAFVKIEDGCANYCSYCIIPKATGPVRSKPLDMLKEELRQLAENGYKEVVLVGINLTAYGRDLGLSFFDAVKTACEIDGIERVRLGSLEPDDMTEELIKKLSALKKLCPQFHLSLQSGCDEILSAMNRRYSCDEYRQAVGNLRRYFDDPAITTDIMVGFPGETQEYFETSVEFAKEIGFSRAHVFSYSRRPGTKADTMPDQIDNAVKSERNRILQQAAAETAEEYMKRLIGSVKPVLFEKSEQGQAHGYIPEYISVMVSTDKCLTDTIADVRITGIYGECCTGELI